MLSDRTLAYSHEIAAAFLGADALYRQHPNGDNIGLVIMNLAGDRIKAEAFSSLDDGLQRFAELQRQAVELPEVDRRLFYQQMCHTTMSILKWLRDDLPLADQIRDFLHLPGKPPTDAELDRLRKQMHELLNTMGYDGDLREQCAAWEQQNRVPPEAVQEVMETLLDEGWERTAKRINLPAPKDDGMRVITLSSDHFNARCDYVARTVEINTNPIITRPSLKHLVAHEAYPGHYVQFKLRETGYDAGTAPAEGLFSMLKSPSSCMFEGVADYGIHTLDWVEDDDDRFMGLMTHYRAAIAAAAAWRLHALQWDQVSALCLRHHPCLRAK